MGFRSGDKAKKPPECKTHEYPTSCPHLKERNDYSMSGETYNCAVCGEYLFLDYEEMK